MRDQPRLVAGKDVETAYETELEVPCYLFYPNVKEVDRYLAADDSRIYMKGVGGGAAGYVGRIAVGRVLRQSLPLLVFFKAPLTQFFESVALAPSIIIVRKKFEQESLL